MDSEEKRGLFLLKNKKIFIIAIIVIFLIAIFLFTTSDKKYKDLEESMLATAKSYLKNGLTGEQYYITLSQMGIKKTYDCSKDSGVNIINVNGIANYEVYLTCDSYKSEKMKGTTGKYIKLLGLNPMIVETNTTFVDPGYKDNGYVVEKISTYKNSPGFYTILYYVYKNGELKETVKRYVIVSNIGSAEAPTITLNGDANIVIKVGGTYVEPGYAAIDPTDGVITSKVLKTSNVNTNVIGEYEVNYKVTNSKGLTTTKKRFVSVIAKDLNLYAQVSLSPELETKNNVIISLKIVGDSYSHTVTPDNKVIKERLVSYEADDNDLYTFKIYDTHGNYSEKKVFVENIDRNLPTGTCTAVSQGGLVTYDVVAEDDSGIKGYSYYAGNTYTEYMSTSTFKYYMDYNLANVIIQDIAGNIAKISCETKKISTITDATMPSSKTIYIGDSYTIPVTITPTTADRKEINFEILSGNNYITLNDGVVKGISAGKAVVRMHVTDSNIVKEITITVKKKEKIPSDLDNDYPSTIADWCGKKAARLTAYLNGNKIEEYSTITMNLGETIRITVYLTKECGQIKQLTRTSADGQSDWRNWFTCVSDPSVDRYDENTFVYTDHYDWVITANARTNGKSIQLSQTSFQSTSKFSEIKSFFNVYVKVK